MRKFIAMAFVILLSAGAVLTMLVWTNKKQVDHERRDASAKSAKRTFEVIEDTSERVTPIVKATGLCREPCPDIRRPSGLTRWSLHTDAGSVLVILYPNLHGKGGFHLAVYSVSPKTDGTVRATPLTETLQSLLQEFGFPDPTAPYREYHEKSVENGLKEYRSMGPRKLDVIWPSFPHRERMATQWVWSVTDDPSSRTRSPE